MPARDVAQLILEVDARIATAQRSVNQLAKAVQQDAATMDTALGKVAQSHARLGQALNDNGRLRAGFTQLSFQIGDVTQQMSLGVSGARIFAQQSGQVIQALQVMGGEGNKFLQFLGGPWGIAISTAAVILAPLAGKLFDTGDEVGKLVDKMREQAKQAALNRQADEAWKHTIDGLTEAIHARRLEQEKALQTDIQSEQQSLRNAQAALAEQKGNAARAEQDLREAQTALATARNAPQLAGAGGQAQESRVAILTAKVERLRNAAAEAAKSVDEAERSVRAAEIPIDQRQVKGSIDPVVAATNRYTEALGRLNDQRMANLISEKEYNRQLAIEEKRLKDAQKATDSSSRQSGRQVDFDSAAAIARAAGLQVNSGYRSPAKQAALFNDPAVNRPGNPVAPPGASAHNGANGKWAIDIQITDGLTPGKIRKVFADQGVSLTKVLKEKGHFHVEGSRSEAAKAENDQVREQDAAVRQQNAFEEQRDRLNQELLQAQGQLLQGITAQADFAEQMVAADQARRDAEIQNDVEEKKLSQAQADQLKAINASIAAEKIKAIETGKEVDLIRQQDERQQRTFEYQLDDLRFADEQARTQAEHRRLQLEILDIVYQEKLAHLENLKHIAEANKEFDTAADLQAQIDRLPTDKAQDRSRVVEGTMSPLEAWARDAKMTADQINEAFQSIEVQGLNGLTDAITEVVMGTKSLGEAFGDVAKSIIADIIRMTVRMMIFRVLAGALGGGLQTVDVGSAAPLGSMPSTIGGTVAALPGFASGGSVVIGGRGGIDNNVLSLNGSPIAMVSQGETLSIVPNAPRVGALTASGSSAAPPARVEITVSPSGEFDARVAQTSAAVVQVMRRGIVSDAQRGTIRSLSRPRLG